MNKKTILNPVKLIPKLFSFEGLPEDTSFKLGHIKYDSNVNEEYDYRLIRSSTHDGTMLFTMQLLGEVLEPIVLQKTYCAKHFSPEEAEEKIKGIKYTIGDIFIENDFGVKDINGVKIHGQTETATLHVKCDYILK